MKALNIQNQIERLQKELNTVTTVKAILPEALQSALIVGSKLYGVEASLIFKAEEVPLSIILANVEPVFSAKYKGVFDYTVPETYDILKEKDSKATFQGNREATAIISENGYKLDFYAMINGVLFDITVNYMSFIIGNRYSTLATGKKIPHLQKRYRKNKFESEYVGINGACDSNNYEYRKPVTFKDSLNLLEGV